MSGAVVVTLSESEYNAVLVKLHACSAAARELASIEQLMRLASAGARDRFARADAAMSEALRSVGLDPVARYEFDDERREIRRADEPAGAGESEGA
jgi:hypothetical protein